VAHPPTNPWQSDRAPPSCASSCRCAPVDRSEHRHNGHVGSRADRQGSSTSVRDVERGSLRRAQPKPRLEFVDKGFFEREITPLTLPDGTVVTKDDGPRPGTNYEGVSQLKPAFRPDGTVTAGNACPLNDGAAAVLVMSDAKAKALGLTPLARIVSSGVSGLNPEIMGLGPIEACRKAMALAGMTIDQIDLVEINEAFAVQVIGSARHLVSISTSNSTSTVGQSLSVTPSA